MITTRQMQLLHIARRAVGITTDPAYRTLLRNVAGVASCRDLDQRGFEDVMAVLEDLGFQDASAQGHGDYWRAKVRLRGEFANERIVRKIAQLAALCDRYPLAAMVLRMSGHRTQEPSKLDPREAYNLIEALKEIVIRERGLGAFYDLTDPDTRRVPFVADQPATVGVEDDVPF